LHLLEAEYQLWMRKAELQWVRSLLEDLRSGQLTWTWNKSFTKSEKQQHPALRNNRPNQRPSYKRNPGKDEPTPMPSTTTSPATSAAISSDNRLAIATLLLLAPLIGEVLSGATRLSFIFAFMPEIMVWAAALC